MSILSVDQISPIGSGTTITLNATEVKTGTEITVGTGASIFSPAGNTLTFGTNNVERIRIKNDGKVGIATDTGSGLINTRHAGTNQQVLHVRADLGSSNGRVLNIFTPDTDNTTAPFRFQTGNGYLFQCDTENVLTISHDRRVGIGTDAPSQKLEVQDRSGGTLCGLSVGTQYGNAHFGGYNNYPAIMNSGNQPLIYCDTNNDRTIFFGDTVGFGTTCSFRVNSAERLRIQSDGTVRFYNSIYGGDNKPIYLGNSNDLSLFHDSGGSSIVRYNHSVGGLHFRNNSNADQMVIDSSGNVTVNNGNIIIGTAGKGIDFSVTAGGSGGLSEILRDYEEGSFTATLSASGGGASFAGGHIQTACLYVKIGSMVHIQGYFSGVNITAGGTGIVKVSGLPYASHNTTYYTIGITHDTVTSNSCVGAYVQYGNTFFYPIQANATSGSAFNVGNPRYLMFGGSYPTQF